MSDGANFSNPIDDDLYLSPDDVERDWRVARNSSDASDDAKTVELMSRPALHYYRLMGAYIFRVLWSCEHSSRPLAPVAEQQLMDRANTIYWESVARLNLDVLSHAFMQHHAADTDLSYGASLTREIEIMLDEEFKRKGITDWRSHWLTARQHPFGWRVGQRPSWCPTWGCYLSFSDVANHKDLTDLAYDYGRRPWDRSQMQFAGQQPFTHFQRQNAINETLATATSRLHMVHECPEGARLLESIRQLPTEQCGRLTALMLWGVRPAEIEFVFPLTAEEGIADFERTLRQHYEILLRHKSWKQLAPELSRRP